MENKQIWPVKWGQERRLEFIEFRLLWEGRVNRGDLTSFFGISVPQASLDLALYQERAPQNLEYDRQQKTYVASSRFTPILGEDNPLFYLDQVWEVEAGLVARESTFLGWYPSSAVIRPPVRAIKSAVLRGILEGQRFARAVKITYQSMTRDEPTSRMIGPHSLVFDGLRWHVRAYCYERKGFRDFVIDRISECTQTQIDRVDPREDDEWNQLVAVVLRPASKLTAAQKKAVMHEYSMRNGHLELPTRKALLPYLLRKLPIITSDPNSKHNHLEIENADELKTNLDSLGVEFSF